MLPLAPKHQQSHQQNSEDKNSSWCNSAQADQMVLPVITAQLIAEAFVGNVDGVHPRLDPAQLLAHQL